MSTRFPERRTLKVQAGDVVTLKLLEFKKGWDYDRPVILLYPLRIYKPACKDMHTALEDILVDLSSRVELKDETLKCAEEFTWRGWKWVNLLDTHRNLIRDKYSSRKYRALTAKVRFFQKHEGSVDLAYEVIELREST